MRGGFATRDDTMAPFEIRILTSADVHLMRGMLGMFAQAFAEPKTYLDAQPNNAYLSSQLAKSHVIAIAATTGETVVGGL